jgi:hypothetical protein
MKKSILFYFVIATVFFATSCAKEDIFVQEIQEEITPNQFAHLALPETVTVKVSENPFTANDIQQLKERTETQDFQNYEKEAPPKIYVDRVQPCEHGVCDPKVEEYAVRLQKLANEYCEDRFGEIVCCYEGRTMYILMIAQPNRIDCIKGKKASNNTSDDRTAEPDKVTRVLNIGVHIETCHRDNVFTLMAYNKDNFEAFEGRRYAVDWFVNDRYIDSGSQLNCISGEEITVFVQDFVQGIHATETIQLPIANDDNPRDIKINYGTK